MRRSRLGWAGLISVLLHAAILALLWEQEPVRPVSAPSPKAAPLVVEVLTSPPEPPPPPPEPLPPAPAQPEEPRPVPRPKQPAEQAAARPEPAPVSTPDKPAPAVAAPAPSPQSGRPEDAPLAEELKRPSLMPPTPSGGWSVPDTAEAPRGRTLLP